MKKWKLRCHTVLFGPNYCTTSSAWPSASHLLWILTPLCTAKACPSQTKVWSQEGLILQQNANSLPSLWKGSGKNPSLSQIPRRKYVIQGDHMSTKLHSALYFSSSHPKLSHHDLSSCLRLLESKSTLANFLYASLFLMMTLFLNSLKLTQIDPSSTALAPNCPSSGLLLPYEKPRGRGQF